MGFTNEKNRGVGRGKSPETRASLKPYAFKPGNKKSPRSGRMKLTEDLRAIKLIHKDEVDRLIAKILRMKAHELSDLQKDLSLSNHELLIIRIVALAVKEGDHQRLNFLYNRIIGKVPDAVPEGFQNGGFAKVQIYIPDNGRSNN